MQPTIEKLDLSHITKDELDKVGLTEDIYYLAYKSMRYGPQEYNYRSMALGKDHKWYRCTYLTDNSPIYLFKTKESLKKCILECPRDILNLHGVDSNGSNKMTYDINGKRI